MRKVIIKGAGVLYSEIILAALQEYRKQCNVNGYHCRADVVSDIINGIEFDHTINKCSNTGNASSDDAISILY